MNSVRGEEEIGSLVTSKNEYISIVKSLVINKFGKSVFFPMDLGLTKLKHVNCLCYSFCSFIILIICCCVRYFLGISLFVLKLVCSTTKLVSSIPEA